MTGSVVTKARALLVRGLAVAAVVLTYTAGNIGTQVLSAVGVSSLALTTSATPAKGVVASPPGMA
jgi:hypothetical protein